MADTFHPPAPKDIRSPLRFLLWLVTSQRRRVATGALLGSLWMVGLAVPPYLLSRAIDDGLRAQDSSALLGWTAALFVMGVVNAVVGILRHRTMTKVRMDASFRTVRATVRQATSLGAGLRSQAGAGEVVAIGMGDVQVIAMSLTVMGPGVGAVLAYLVVAALLLSISPLLAVVVLAGVPLLAVTVGPLQRRLLGVGSEYRQRQGALTELLVDVVTGLRVLNGLGGKDVYASRYGQRSRELREQGYRVGAVTSWIGALAIGLPALFLALVTWLTARMAAEGSLAVGDLVAVYGYTAMLVTPVYAFIEGGSDVARGLVAARRVIDFLGLRPGHLHDTGRLDAPPGPAVLHDPASGVQVPPGALIALIGDRPADAPAVVERLGRFTPSDAAWDGHRVDAMAPDQFRERVLVADNDAHLFSGTVREVVAGGQAIDHEAILAAIGSAAATDIVQAMPEGLDSVITAQGANLSGGQRQRLRLARALYARPEVLLAVEPTSAVDAHTEAAMAAGLRAARTGLTTVVTSTSPLVLELADTVVYLVGGQVEATGTHQHLLHARADYRALVSRGAEEEEEVSR
ncbi:ABC transporter ATP-binding protein [Streptomyces sp. SID13666]|uniref:ABC transporter ATP-binding protein n=1 Tax=unclassified Streptomyces TaxID=2593676 RepID=UPI0013C1BC79|nr:MULTISPECIES: ABC transporter ATP-binding protein [unclassified Streptomyces]NEA53294.1 ABC transporter ATP-binding protein [Streptomyces sp. SID13666]NEA69379.1 ABC transporter ATP-binding protein [Streptomyces sp. SID13588]